MTIERLSAGLLRFVTEGTGAEEVLAPDAFFDFNVPQWRYQRRGIEDLVAQVKEWGATDPRVTWSRTTPTGGGFVVEWGSRWTEEGEDLSARQIAVCEVEGDRIAEVALYCTGPWDAATRARQAAEAPMIRPVRAD